jgi:hypothetical protein
VDEVFGGLGKDGCGKSQDKEEIEESVWLKP